MESFAYILILTLAIATLFFAIAFDPRRSRHRPSKPCHGGDDLAPASQADLDVDLQTATSGCREDSGESTELMS